MRFFIVGHICRGRAGQIASALHRQALQQQAGCYVLVGGQQQGGFQLFAAAHVVFERVCHIGKRLAVRIRQGHNALIGLLAGLAIQRIQRNGAAAFAMRIDQFSQAGIGCHLAHHACGCTQPQIGQHFGHGHFHGAIALHLQNQGAVEADGRLQQNRAGNHLAQHGAHGGWVCAAFRIVGAAFEHFLPGVGQANDDAPNGQSIEKKFLNLRHGWMRERRKAGVSPAMNRMIGSRMSR